MYKVDVMYLVIYLLQTLFLRSVRRPQSQIPESDHYYHPYFTGTGLSGFSP